MEKLTLHDVFSREISDDRRNVDRVSAKQKDRVERLIVTCARRYIEALDFGSPELVARTEENLRLILLRAR